MGNIIALKYAYAVISTYPKTQISITIAGDTSGTWLTTNGAGIQAVFSYGDGSTYLNTAGSWYAGLYDGATGQTNLVGTNGATFYITGVQVEIGTTATNFDYRSYGTELALCQRYCYRPSRLTPSGNPRVAIGNWGNSTSGYFCTLTKVPLRASPSLTVLANGQALIEAVAWYPVTGTPTISSEATADMPWILFNVASSAATSGLFTVWGNGADYYVSAEL